MDQVLAAINPAWLANGGITALIVVSIIKGWMVPSPTVDRLKAEADAREVQLRREIETLATHWESRLSDAREDAQLWRQAHAVAAGQVTALMEIGAVTEKVLRSLPTAPDQGVA